MNIEPGDKVEYIGPDNYYKHNTPVKNRPYTVEEVFNGTWFGSGQFDFTRRAICISLKEDVGQEDAGYDINHFTKLQPFADVLENIEVAEHEKELVEQ